jgi:hypothetical protein
MIVASYLYKNDNIEKWPVKRWTFGNLKNINTTENKIKYTYVHSRLLQGISEFLLNSIKCCR